MEISADKPGSLVLLNGDEAVARGALEAGVKVTASYPGTPATEILETITEFSKEFDIYAEWSINEKVATEVAAGAAMSGVRSMVSMKNVGLNVASDAVMTLAYTGVIGGMVIVVCDDPSLHSSQNAQDTRYFAVHANLPLLDAGNPQEAKDMTVNAFELSEKLELPIILRLTTRVSHGKERVTLGEINKLRRSAEFDKDGSRWTMTPSNAVRRHDVLYDRLAQAKEFTEKSKFNIIEDNGGEFGVIGSGVSYYYARSVLDRQQFSWLKLGFVNPFPADLVKRFTTKAGRIVVVEELRPYIENNIRCLCTKVLGKKELDLEERDELSPDVLRRALAKFSFCNAAKEQKEVELPSRPPGLCPGCPHRAFYYALNTVKKDKIATGDIGCYGLGTLSPLNTIQTALCMGAGISQAAGMRHAGVNDTIFAMIGDSTFFHAGMPALLNIAYNYANICVVIMDNQTVAMTGHQPTPETGGSAMGGISRTVRIENIVNALGIDRIEIVDPYNVNETRKVIKEILNYDGPSVIISKRKCALLVEKGNVRGVTSECDSCGICVKVLGCPAISMTSEHAEIDSTLCRGCGVCEQICPYHAIRSEK
jgi:indolepyruvate ferredoxin oxidoreductase alpha subunit